LVTIKRKNVLDLIHSDIWESLVESIGGSIYFLSFVDNFSRKVWVYMLKKKSDPFSRFENVKALVENQAAEEKTDHEIKYTTNELK
jgi:hypothetical protein